MAAPQLLGQTGPLQEIAPSLDMGSYWGAPSGASCCEEGGSTLGHLGACSRMLNRLGAAWGFIRHSRLMKAWATDQILLLL